jgi:hypothetical protein
MLVAGLSLELELELGVSSEVEGFDLDFLGGMVERVGGMWIRDYGRSRESVFSFFPRSEWLDRLVSLRQARCVSS